MVVVPWRGWLGDDVAWDGVSYHRDDMELRVLPHTMAVARLGPHDEIPSWARRQDGLVSVTRTADELSVVCPEELIPEAVARTGGWACLQVVGPLDLSSVGVLAGLAAALASHGISIFAVSTFDTDYLLVPGARLDDAIGALCEAGHGVARE
jgi:hypothetical protein